MEVVSIWLKNAVEQFSWKLSLQLGEITLVIICGYSQLPDNSAFSGDYSRKILLFLKTTPYFDPKVWLFMFLFSLEIKFLSF